MALHTASPHHSFFATCPRNTEGLLLDELRSLGAADAAETRAGVAFSGPLPLAYRSCLWSRVASRVLMRITSFPATCVDDLYEGVHLMSWEDHLDPRGTLAVEVTSTVRQGPLAQLNTHFAEQRVKDAVVDRFRARTGTRPGVNLVRPHVRINLHVTPADTIVSLDLAGEGLHRRGYRLEGGGAPLKENLAAAILLRAGWPRIASAGGSLVDPMCGSGTLAIEGLLMAGDIAPGMLREYFGFLGWRGFDPEPWAQLIEEARERRAQGLQRLPDFYGYDVDPRAIGTARGNAQRAGLAGRIIFERRDVASMVAPDRRPTLGEAHGRPGRPSGLVIANPPYGKRLGEISELAGLYETLGEKLKGSFSGWEAAIFTGNPELGAHLDLRAHRANVFFNGPIPCKLLLFHIDPLGFQNAAFNIQEGTRGTRTAGQTDSHAAIGEGAQMFANRLRKNLRHLRRWVAREHIDCYRLYDADLPEYAVAVDLYGDWAHVREYEPPRTVDPVQARRRLKEIMEVTPEVLEIPAEHVVLKVRRPHRGADQYQKLRCEGRFLEVEEDGLRFLVNLTDYLDTGLFLDHRPTRRLLRELAPGRRFLNLFAYTGSATVCAAKGGASSTTTVDLSPTYLDWAKRNLELNGIYGPQHRLVRADCLDWLDQAGKLQRSEGRHHGRLPLSESVYDLVFLDAPTFSNSKRMALTLDIQRDHPRLIRATAHLLSADGILLFSTNFRRFKLDEALLQEFEVTDVTRQTIAPDFARDHRIHKCFRISPRHDASQEPPNAHVAG